MPVNFSKQDVEILKDCCHEIDEFHYEYRKQISQRKYVFQVDDNATWNDWNGDCSNNPVPPHLIGMWVMSNGRDLQYDNLHKCIEDDSWNRCLKVPVTTYEYQHIKGVVSNATI